MKLNKLNILRIILSAAAVASAIWIIWLSLTPIIDRDATRFHLPFAKLWAENGFLYFRKWFAYYDLNMLNLNYLYMLVFKFGLPDQLTKVIHASFLLAGGYLIFRYFKEKYGLNWGLLSFIMYITIPIHQRLASEVYVDLGLLFFSTFSIIYFIKWLESGLDKGKYLFLSALGTGTAFGTKYNAMIFAFFMTLFVGLVTAREKKDDKRAINNIVIYSALIIACASPWLLRNFINSGNPFFPLFNSVIPSDISMPKNLVEGGFGEIMNRIVNGGESIFSLFMLPFRVFFQGADHDFLKFDGVLNPFMLLLLPFLYWPKNRLNADKRKLISYLLIAAAVIYLTTLYVNDIRIRYFIPVYPIIFILDIEALKRLGQVRFKFKYSPHILSVLFLLYNLNYSVDYYRRYNLINYNPFLKSSKQEYLKIYLRNYEIITYINENIPENSVVYEAFTGGRSYYINRAVYSDTYPLDRYFIELARNGSPKEAYLDHLKNLPNSDLSATHLLIRANNFIQTFYEINYDENDPDNVENAKNISGYIKFIQEMKFLKEKDGIYLFELIK
ncbi:MAG: glycosyltransferase family 39 protein [Spirochaetes bacterium]|nr:glycosyltransferase family 39 protein [Spirochaetota bacterium]